MNARLPFNICVAEAIGTFALVFFGCGAIIVNDLAGGVLGHAGVCAVFGLVVMAVIYAIGNVSGAHINPAVTMAFVLAGRMPRSRMLPYIASQLAGGLLAALLLLTLFPTHEGLGATLPAGPSAQSFIIEAVMSFFLMFVILNVSSGHQEKGLTAGVAIGGTVALEALFGGPVSGASMNPVRSLAPALVSGELGSIWIYLLAPVLGMLLAAPSCRWVQGPQCCGSSPVNPITTP
jgi:aquaporin Z